MRKRTFPDDGEKEYSERAFEGLDLNGARLESRHFHSCVFRNCDLTGAGLRFCRFRECRFESCNLSLVSPNASSFEGPEFRNSKLTGLNWTEAAWPKLNLSGPPRFFSCVLSDCVFMGLDLAGAVMKDCLAKGADLRDSDLTGADLSGTDFSGALFGGTKLLKANLSGARNYAINVGTCPVKGARFSLPEAMALLDGLGIKLD